MLAPIVLNIFYIFLVPRIFREYILLTLIDFQIIQCHLPIGKF